MAIETYTVSLDKPNAELVYEIDYDIVSRERFFILNELWRGATARLSHFEGDPVAATLSITSNAAIEAAKKTGCTDRSGIIKEMRKQLGYSRLDGLSGIELVSFTMEHPNKCSFEIEKLQHNTDHWWED